MAWYYDPQQELQETCHTHCSQIETLSITKTYTAHYFTAIFGYKFELGVAILDRNWALEMSLRAKLLWMVLKWYWTISSTVVGRAFISLSLSFIVYKVGTIMFICGTIDRRKWTNMSKTSRPGLHLCRPGTLIAAVQQNLLKIPSEGIVCLCFVHFISFCMFLKTGSPLAWACLQFAVNWGWILNS